MGWLLFFMLLFTPFWFNCTAALAPSCVRAESEWRESGEGLCPVRGLQEDHCYWLYRSVLRFSEVLGVSFNCYAGVSTVCPWKCSFPHTWVSTAQWGQFSMLLHSHGVPLPAAVPMQCWAALQPVAVLLPFFFPLSNLANTMLLTAFVSWHAVVAVRSLVLFLLP